MKLILYRCLVFLLLSLALSLVAGPWTDASMVTERMRGLLGRAQLSGATPDEAFVPLPNGDFHSIQQVASNLVKEAASGPHRARIRVTEWRRLCRTLGVAGNSIVRVSTDGIDLTVWYGEYTRTVPVALPYFAAMRHSIGWVLLFFGVILSRRLYAPPPYLSKPMIARVFFWDLLALLALSIAAFYFLEYMATAFYKLTPSADAEGAQVAAIFAFVTLLPVLAALISLPCVRSEPHF